MFTATRRDFLWNFSLAKFVWFLIRNTYHRHFVDEKLVAQTINHKIQVKFIEFSNKFKAENLENISTEDETETSTIFFFCYFSVAMGWMCALCVVYVCVKESAMAMWTKKMRKSTKENVRKCKHTRYRKRKCENICSCWWVPAEYVFNIHKCIHIVYASMHKFSQI